MSEREAFIRTICAEPEDETPRLAYADWLDEQDNEGDSARAAYIRDSVEVHRIGLSNVACERTGLSLWTGAPDAVGCVPVPRCRCRICSLLRGKGRSSLRWLRTWTTEILGEIGTQIRASISEQRRKTARDRRANASSLPPTFAEDIVQQLMWLMPRIQFRRGFGEILHVAPITFEGWGGFLFRRMPCTKVRVALEPESMVWTAPSGGGLVIDWAQHPRRVAQLANASLQFASTLLALEYLSDVYVQFGRQERDRAWAAPQAIKG
jgi:uncharacterized protein (TIGR02996 family)